MIAERRTFAIRVVYGLLCAQVLLAPLPLGSNRPLFWVFNALLVVAMLGALAIGRLAPAVPFRLVWPLLAGFLALAGWTAVQTALASGGGASIPEVLQNLASIDPDATFWQLLRYLTMGALFLVVFVVGRGFGLADRLLRFVFWTVAGYATLSFLFFVVGADSFFNTDDWAYAGFLTGPYIARNAFAAYLGTGLVIGLALLSAEVGRLRAAGEARSLPATAVLLQFLTGRSAGYGLAMFVIFSALVLTGSRAGMAVTLVALLIVLLLAALRRQGRHGMALPLAIVILSGFVALAVGGASMVQRFATVESEAGKRVSLYVSALSGLSERPLAGFGGGTFPALFPTIRSQDVPVDYTFSEAHNTYLEVALESGLPVAVIWFAGLGFALHRVVGGAIRRRRGHEAALVATGAMILYGLHSLVDFPAQIQANTLGLVLLLALGLAQSFRDRDLKAAERPG